METNFFGPPAASLPLSPGVTRHLLPAVRNRTDVGPDVALGPDRLPNDAGRQAHGSAGRAPPENAAAVAKR